MVFHKNRLSIFLVACALFGMGAVAAPAVEAAVIRVINNDNPGEGFNDPTPVAPVGGNTGTTLGQQRLIAFQTCGGHLGWAHLECRADPGRCHVRSIAV